MKFNSGLGIISRDCRINPDLSIEICVAINNMTVSFVTGANSLNRFREETNLIRERFTGIHQTTCGAMKLLELEKSVKLSPVKRACITELSV